MAICGKQHLDSNHHFGSEAESLLSTNLQKFRLIIFSIIIITLCGGGVVFFLHHIPVRQGVVSKETAISDQAQQKDTRQTEKNNNYESISNRNLFGTSSDDPGIKGKNSPIENLAPTTLDVVLVGTVFGDNDEKRAIILEKGQTAQEMYHIGDSVKGAIVKDIRRGKVVLGYNNKDEILTMSEGKGQTPESAAAVPSLRQQKILRVLREKQPSSPDADPDVPGARIVPVWRQVIPKTGNKATTN